MNDQVRAVVFVLLALVILFTWGHFYKPAVPPLQSSPAQTVPQSTTAESASAAPSVVATATQGAKTGPGGGAIATTVQVTEEKTATVESSLFVVELSNRGGVVRSWKLKKYWDDEKTHHPLDLVNASAAQQLGWPFSLVLSDAQLEARANSALYEVQAVGAVVIDKASSGSNAAAIEAAARAAAGPAGAGPFQAPIKIIFHWSDGHLDVTKTLTFGLNYETTVEVAVTLDGKPQPVAVAWRGG